MTTHPQQRGGILPQTETAPNEPAVSGPNQSQPGLDIPGSDPLAGSDQGPKDDEQDSGQGEEEASLKYYLKVFAYNDRLGWLMNSTALVCMIASGALLPLMEIIFGKFVNIFNSFVHGELSPGKFRSEINKYTLLFVYLFIARFVSTYIWTVLISTSAIRTTKALRVDVVRHTLRQEVSYFDSSFSSISGQITTNGNLINTGISEKLGNTVQALSTFFSAFIVAFASQWKLTLIVAGIVPVNIIVTFVCAMVDAKYENEMFAIYSRSSSLAEESFSTIRTAHAFWAFPKLSSRFTKILQEARKVGDKKSPIYAVLYSIEYFLIFAGYGLAFWQGMRMYSTGEIEHPGTVVVVIFAMIVAATALTQLLPQSIAISKAAAAAHSLFNIIERKSLVDPLSGEGETIPDFKGNIQFRGVRFSYPSRPGVPILHGLDLDIPAEQTTALVGASGSGKSTIFGLLERWYIPDGGSITLDGRPIETLNLTWLRTNVRLVQQEPTLFSGTIFQNVVDGLTGTETANLPDEEKQKLVMESCKAAYAHDFIERLPKGYETYIGERGASLSGGQKQRIVIARSIISNPKVLMLDEATSALDPNAEKIVQQALNNVARGRTMIVIAHRLSTIQEADNIIVMAKGDTVEQGTHSELIGLKGAYAKLVTAQDLGQGASADENGNDDEDEIEAAKAHHEDAILDTIASRASTANARKASEGDGTDYGLLKCLFLILREQKPLWWPSAFLLLLSVIGGGTFPVLALLFSRTMSAFETVDVSRANFFALMFFVLALVNLVIYIGAGYTSNFVAQHVMEVYRAELFSNTLRQDMTFFDNPELGTGALVSRLASEPTYVQELLSMNISLLMINIVIVISSVILAIAAGWKLGLVLTFGALPVLLLAGYIRIRLEYKFEDETAGRFAKSSSLASEAVLGIRTVSSLALEAAIIERYDASLAQLATQAIRSLGLKMLFYSMSQSTTFLAQALGFWYGGRLMASNEYTTEQFYIVFVAIIFSGEFAAQIYQYSTSITRAKPAMNYIFRLRRQIGLPEMGDENEGDGEASCRDEKQASDKGTAIVCDNIGFAYPRRPRLQVLDGIDIKIESGKMTAFVGASGCGKSTMVALLERFYDSTSGMIRADGEDIRTKDRRLYRRHIALVQQEPVLYQGSIRHNISLGLEDVDPTEEEIIAACEQANIYDFVASLPEGLGTPCGNQGLSLSGGQRQRIAIARALIRKPRLLLLDEATSALDTESEKIVKEALDRAAEGRTTVAIAHRLSTIRDADVIVVFVEGKVAEMGRHVELVAKRGLYYEMVLGQSLDREAS